MKRVTLAILPSTQTPSDSLHEVQKDKGEPGGYYGPRTGPYDEQPWQGNRDGFDAKNPPRQRVKRKFIPHMDTPDDEGSGFVKGLMGNNEKKKADFNPAAPIVETPEERAAQPEQPPVKPLNWDPKRPTKPKKRYDTNEQNLISTPNYMGEDSNEFSRERTRLSMKRVSQDRPISSTLNVIIQDVYAAKTLDEGREIIRNHLLASQINERDKQKMLLEIDRQPTLEALWQYISNALLKYEGFGAI